MHEIVNAIWVWTSGLKSDFHKYKLHLEYINTCDDSKYYWSEISYTNLSHASLLKIVIVQFQPPWYNFFCILFV